MRRKFVIGILISIAAAAAVVTFIWRSEATPVGIVIPHHDMVASVRRAYLDKVSSLTQPKTIVVFVPDHFNQSKEHISTTKQPWDTILGVIESDTELVDILGLPQDDGPFQSEHGLTVLLKDLKQYFPKASIVPIMLSRSATYQEVSELVDELYINCPSCLVVSSVDFSHTNTANVAALHDVLTLRELSRRNSVELYKHAEVDSPEALVALVLWSKKHGAERFKLFSHTNSGYLADRTEGEMTSHIIGGYTHGKAQRLNDDIVTLMFGGDTMFARGVHEEFMTSSTSPLAPLGERFFWGVDVALVNLEGVFSKNSDYKNGWEKIPPRLLFTPSYIEIIKASRVSAVGLANNHTFDEGEAGAAFTSQALTDEGITSVGYPRENPTVLLTKQGSTKVAVVSIATHEETKDIALEVEKYSMAGYKVVAYVHWGSEYQLAHNETQEAMAKRLVEAGADLVVGSHPHVVQDVGVYQGVPIVYSLGNFLFDQNFKEETQAGAVLGVKINSESVEIFIVPVQNYLSVRPVSEDKMRGYISDWTKGWKEYEVPFYNFYFANLK